MNIYMCLKKYSMDNMFNILMGCILESLSSKQKLSFQVHYVYSEVVIQPSYNVNFLMICQIYIIQI